jgi:hypothetical protein
MSLELHLRHVRQPSVRDTIGSTMYGRRLGIATTLAGAAVALALLAGSGASPVVILRFRRPNISFDYPSTWQVRSEFGVGAFAAGLSKFSSQGFNVPCRYESCWVPPGGHLEPGGVFGDWEAYSPSGGVSLPAAQFVQVGRLHVWFDRRPARDRCKAMSGTEALSVFVQRRTPKDWYLMDACLRWPTSTTEGLIHRMLASADFLDLP